MNDNNPLFSQFLTPHQTPPFNDIKVSHYIPAFNRAIEFGRAEIAAIVDNPQAPGFQNTIEALDASGRELRRLGELFFNLVSAETNDEMQAVAREVSPLLTGFSNDIWLDASLFARVKQVHESKEGLCLEPDQRKLLEDTYKAFARRGALLSAEGKKRYREITLELARLQLEFGENLLAETNDFKLHLTKQSELDGLPDAAIEAAAKLASDEGKEGWIFSLDAPSLIPFLKYSARRDYREVLFKASASRCNRGNGRDNNANILAQVALRLQQANLLGYKTYADYVIEERMAGSVTRVNSFLNELLEKSLEHARRDIEEVKEFARMNGMNDDFQRWDYPFYSEKLKNQLFSIDDEIVRPYFELSNVTRGIFDLTTRLWGVSYRYNPAIEVYHPDVKAYEVFDSNGEFLAVLYLDFFPRRSKQGGAWMTSYRNQYFENGQDTRPQISLVCNFTPPGASRPSLLNYNEFVTFLHEFGHALHGIFSKVRYEGQSGTNVARDFVELPSQIMENWAREKEWLQQVAVHYKTGEPIPGNIVDKIIEAANFQSGYQIARQLGFAYNDMAWHSVTSHVDVTPSDFERKATERVELFPVVEGSCTSSAFSHIFDGGYAAGYYGYKWAEVLDADAYSLFREKGIFDGETARRFRELILSKGGSAPPMELFVSFRGKEPAIEPLLERCGLTR